MTLAAAHAGARARQGGAALARPFDGQNSDAATGPGRTVALTAAPAAAGVRGYAAGTGGHLQSAYLGTDVEAISFPYTPGQPIQLEVYAGAQTVLKNIASAIPVFTPDGNANLALVNARVSTNPGAQTVSDVSQAAIQAAGLILNADVTATSEDGIWPQTNTARLFDQGGEYATSQPGAGWTLIENFRAYSAQAPMYGGAPFGGTLPYNATAHPSDAPGGATAVRGSFITEAEILSAIPYSGSGGALPAGRTLTVGGYVSAPTKGALPAIQPIYQCIGTTDGLAPALGTESTSTWPPISRTSVEKWSALTASSNAANPVVQPFISGNCIMILVGAAFHCDGSQTLASSGIIFRDFEIKDFPDVCLLLQNAAATQDPLPPMNWRLEHGVVRGAGSYDFLVQTQYGDNQSTWTIPTGAHNQMGGYIRNSDGSWQVANQNLGPGIKSADRIVGYGGSSPWYVTFRDIVHEQATSTFSGSRSSSQIAYWGNAYSLYGKPVLPDENTRDLLVANQFGWDSGDRRVAMMRRREYDYATLGLPAPDSAVMEARLQAADAAIGSNAHQCGALSPVPGCMNAMCMPVMTNIRDQNGAPITPSTQTVAHGGFNYPVSTAVTDSRGFWNHP